MEEIQAAIENYVNLRDDLQQEQAMRARLVEQRNTVNAQITRLNDSIAQINNALIQARAALKALL